MNFRVYADFECLNLEGSHGPRHQRTELRTFILTAVGNRYHMNSYLYDVLPKGYHVIFEKKR